MIKFFRKIRYYHMETGKTSPNDSVGRAGPSERRSRAGKYLKYAIGEIILVVIGILIALQINNWNQDNENNKLKLFYMKSLKNDLIKDTLDINRITKIQKSDNNNTNSYLKRIYHISANLDTIKKIASDEINYGFQVKRDYSNNTFNTIISTGNIELLDKGLIEKLMELNNMQLDQLKRFDSNLDSYLNIYNNYAKNFPINYSEIPKDNIVYKTLWHNINEKEFIASFTTSLEFRKFMFSNTIKGHLKVKEKSKSILELIESLLND